MLEFTDLAVLSGLLILSTAIFTGIWTNIFRYLADRRLRMVEADVEKLIMTIRSRQGEEGRANAKAEEEAFMAQAAAILKGEGEMPDKLQKIIGMNPAMAMKLAKKLGIGL